MGVLELKLTKLETRFCKYTSKPQQKEQATLLENENTCWRDSLSKPQFVVTSEDNLFRHMSLKPLKDAQEAGSCHAIRVACFDYPTDPKTIQQSFLRFSASSSDWNFGRGFFGVGKPCWLEGFFYTKMAPDLEIPSRKLGGKRCLKKTHQCDQ